MATDTRKDPFRGYNFRLQLERTSVAGFSECGGLSFTVDPVEYREGTDLPLHVRKLTAMRKFANLTMSRGFTDSMDLWNWYKNVLNGIEDRRSGAVILQNELHANVLRWEFENGWICKWEGPALNAANNNVAIEKIEICVERVELR